MYAAPSPFDDLPPEERALFQWQASRAARARENLIDFFEYVIREESSQEPVLMAPHQRVFVKFGAQYQRYVGRLPSGYSKTFLTATDILFELGHDPTMRSLILSASQTQAAKPLSMVRFYIEESPQLRLVFPKLRKTPREGEPWTKTAIVVDRPYGIRDPSVAALGMDTKSLTGSRLTKAYVDDLLSKENSHTREQREAVKSFFRSEVLSRKESDRFRVAVLNTPRDADDLTYELEEKLKWPTITMDAYGDITIANAPDFDCEDIRPAYEIQDDSPADVVRLSAHDSVEYLALERGEEVEDVTEDFDSKNEVSLWPELATVAQLDERFRTEYEGSIIEWNQIVRCRAYSDETSKVKRDWILRAHQKARDLGFPTTRKSWTAGRTYTGVDLAVGEKRQHDETCLFTIHVDDIGNRIVLDVDAGRWRGTEILRKISEKHEKFGSIIRVETNAAQLWMKEFALEIDPGLPVRSHNTGKNKSDVNFGLEMVFTDIENGLWAIPPNDKEVAKWIGEMYSYDPDKHTGDRLMASWLAREQARASGAFASARAKRRGIDRNRILSTINAR